MTDRSPPLAESLPKRSYVDEADFDREREAVFYSDWFCVARTESILEPGDYVVADVAGESIVVVRTADGGVSAFYNLCRHRGSRLVEPRPEPAAQARADGHFDRSVRCPYHSWTYALDGSLKAAPYLPEVRGGKQRLSLHEVAVLSWGGFVFCCVEPSSAPPDVGESLRAVAERLVRYEIDRLRVATRIVYDVSANWKVILENYNECYHCGPVHPELCEIVPAFGRGGRDLDWEAGIPHRKGAVTFTTTGTTTRSALPGLNDDERIRHKGELIFPNLMLSCSCDHVAAFSMFPRSAARTLIVCDFLFDPDEMARPGFDPSDAVQFWDVVNRQDWRICEQVQDGMTSRRFVTGYLAPMEDPSADVRRYLRSRLEA
jgi:Rieske 2Fe-2S family protein